MVLVGIVITTTPLLLPQLVGGFTSSTPRTFYVAMSKVRPFTFLVWCPGLRVGGHIGTNARCLAICAPSVTGRMVQFWICAPDIFMDVLMVVHHPVSSHANPRHSA